MNVTISKAPIVVYRNKSGQFASSPDGSNSTKAVRNFELLKICIHRSYFILAFSKEKAKRYQ